MFGGGFIEWMDLHMRPAGEGERIERIKTLFLNRNASGILAV